MPTRELTPTAYKKLVTEIACLYEGARKALVEAYWKIGQRIVEVEQQGAIKAAYGTGLLSRLSEDLTDRFGAGFSPDNLQKMRRFYLTYPKNATSRKLTWSQFTELLPVRDEKKRARLEKQAIEEELSAQDIRRLVRQETVREQVALNLVRSEDEVPYGSPNRQLLDPIRGTLYAYRIVQPKLVGETDSELLIDLGFCSYLNLRDITSKKFALNDIVESVKTADGQYSLKKLPSPNPLPRGEDKGEGALFTYVAEVERVVDGDTLRVVVDLGFGFKTRQYLRLRGLDCPEIDTAEGKKASDFVKARIKQADEVVLTSSRSDKYDRYLADVFYTDKDGKEQYLNNLLLESGLAIRVGA